MFNYSISFRTLDKFWVYSAFSKQSSFETMALSKKVICLFDVDGTLTAPRKVISQEMLKFITQDVNSKCAVGLVGGSDEAKISEQMGGQDVINKLDYVFSENGLIAKEKGVEIARTTILSYMGEEKLQTFINYALKCLSEVKLPAKRGNFVEFRTGLLNICPVGRSCSQEERDAFGEYDKVHNIRGKLVESFKKQFPDFGLNYVIGGQISIDVFPKGWDKTYSLKFLERYDKIHFFGDKTLPGGNDHEIYQHSRTIGHAVTSPDDTKQQLQTLFGL